VGGFGAKTGNALGSQVDFTIDIAVRYREPPLKALAGVIVPKVARAIADAFEDWASVVLGIEGQRQGQGKEQRERRSMREGKVKVEEGGLVG